MWNVQNENLKIPKYYTELKTQITMSWLSDLFKRYSWLILVFGKFISQAFLSKWYAGWAREGSLTAYAYGAVDVDVDRDVYVDKEVDKEIDEGLKMFISPAFLSKWYAGWAREGSLTGRANRAWALLLSSTSFPNPLHCPSFPSLKSWTSERRGALVFLRESKPCIRDESREHQGLGATKESWCSSEKRACPLLWEGFWK